jgi:hypothetical protein
MRIVIVAAVVAALSARPTAQQPSDTHQFTTAPPSARFEIVQSQLSARWTFRLDRHTGRVAQLVRTQDDDSAWEEMEVIGGLPPVTTSGRPRFQIFTSGLAAKHTFLIDTDTGRTWMVASGKRRRSDGTEYEYNAWQLFSGQ